MIKYYYFTLFRSFRVNPQYPVFQEFHYLTSQFSFKMNKIKNHLTSVQIQGSVGKEDATEATLINHSHCFSRQSLLHSMLHLLENGSLAKCATKLTKRWLRWVNTLQMHALFVYVGSTEGRVCCRWLWGASSWRRTMWHHQLTSSWQDVFTKQTFALTWKPQMELGDNLFSRCFFHLCYWIWWTAFGDPWLELVFISSAFPIKSVVLPWIYFIDSVSWDIWRVFRSGFPLKRFWWMTFGGVGSLWGVILSGCLQWRTWTALDQVGWGRRRSLGLRGIGRGDQTG